MSSRDRLTTNDANLSRLLRESPLLEPALKSHWLQILPYLMPDDRARLRRIIQAGSVIIAPSTRSEGPPAPPTHPEAERSG